MRVTRHGGAGLPLVYLPSSGGDEREFERYGMVAAAGPWIETGRVSVYCVDGRARDHLWNDALAPSERVARYAAFERELADSLLTRIVAEGRGVRPVVVGASYGAFVAANLWCKHPDRVSGACGLGGVYGLWHRLDGHHDREVLRHTPLEYVPRLDDPAALNALRASRGMVLFSGERDEWLDSTLRFARCLQEKRLPHVLEVWRGEVDHHERWWCPQLREFLRWLLDRPATV